MLFRQPGWAMPNGHIVRSHMEASLCSDLTAVEIGHLHGAPETYSFQVSIGPQRHALYVASIVLTEARADSRQIIVEPIDSAKPGGGARRLAGFRHAHSADYFVIVVARRALHHQLPEDAYDLLLPLEDFRALEDYVRSLG